MRLRKRVRWRCASAAHGDQSVEPRWDRASVCVAGGAAVAKAELAAQGLNDFMADGHPLGRLQMTPKVMGQMSMDLPLSRMLQLSPWAARSDPRAASSCGVCLTALCSRLREFAQHPAMGADGHRLGA